MDDLIGFYWSDGEISTKTQQSKTVIFLTVCKKIHTFVKKMITQILGISNGRGFVYYFDFIRVCI